MQRTPTESHALETATAGELSQIVVAGHELTVYEESPPVIEAMVRDIRAAQQRVWLETYIFADDDAGRAVAEALSDRARAGLDVRLIYDAVGSIGTPNAIFDSMQASGVKVHAYHTIRHAIQKLALFQIFNRRDHRKLLVIDDRIAYFGGMNIVDTTRIHNAAEARAHRMPSSAGWRDVQVRMVGLKQQDCAAMFERLWRKVHDERGRRPDMWPLERMLASQEDDLYFFDCRPSLKHRRAAHVFVPLIKRAMHEITFSMAYFIPIGRVLRELNRARRRGVRIRVIVPGKSDVPLVQFATRYFYEYLLRRGYTIFERKDHMLHSKVMEIDGVWSVVGSCNLDPRSLRLNLELLGVIHSREFAKVIKRICRYEMRNSEQVTAEHCQNRTRWQCFRDRVAWSVRRWL